MKTLAIGVISFLIWSSASTYWYVCKIKNLCYEEGQEVEIVNESVSKEDLYPESVSPENEFIVHHELNEVDFRETDDLLVFAEQMKVELKKNPEARIIIDGLADSRGSRSYNLELGEKRARNVKSFLVAQGISPERINILSEGESHPETTNITEEGRAKNRRTIITIKK